MKRYVCCIGFLWLSVLCSGCLRPYLRLPAHLAENSGLHIEQGRYHILHNDGGNPAELHVWDAQTRLWQLNPVAGIPNTDWEDLSPAEPGYLLLGDIGNNRQARRDLYLAKIPLPQNWPQGDSLRPQALYPFYYPEQEAFPPQGKAQQNFDAEALFYAQGRAYILTKNRSKKPYTGWTYLYGLDLDSPGIKRPAQRLDSLQLPGRFWPFAALTAATLSPDGQTLALLSARRLYLLRDWHKGLAQASRRVYRLRLRQYEALAFLDDKTLILGNESRRGLGRAKLRRKKLR